MRYLYVCLSFMFFSGCSVSKKASVTPADPEKFVYENYFISEKQDAVAISKLHSSIDSLYDPEGIDSIENKSLKEVFFSNLWSETPPTKIHIEVKNDSIWRHTTQNGIMIGDYSMIHKNNSTVIHYYDKSKQFNYQNFDLFQNKEESEITMTTNKDDKKMIQGYECFKLILMRRNNDDFPGKTIYEMYVTDKIDLPAYSVELVLKELPGLFPLEVSIQKSFLPGVREVYCLVEIE